LTAKRALHTTVTAISKGSLAGLKRNYWFSAPLVSTKFVSLGAAEQAQQEVVQVVRI